MEFRSRDFGLTLALKWTVATAIGFAVGGAIGGGVGVFYAWTKVSSPLTSLFMGILGISGMLILSGVVGGLTQWWLLLQQRISGAAWWGLGNILAFIVGALTILGVRVPEIHGMTRTLSGVAESALAGIAVGITQWLFVKRLVARAGWWCLSNFVAFTIFFGSALYWASLDPIIHSQLSHIVGEWEEPLYSMIIASVRGSLIGAALGGGIGIITGVVLVWLLRHSIPISPTGVAHT